MNFRIFGAILRKDVLSLRLLVILTTVLIAGDVVITRLALSDMWQAFAMPILLLASTVFVFSVFQLDSPASLVDDWLCRPVPRAELVAAKLTLVIAVVYLSRVVATFAVDLHLGFSLAHSIEDALLLQNRLYMLLLPLTILTAINTQTLVQGIGALVALFACVFVIPTPLIEAPAPLAPAIGHELTHAGMDWLALGPAKVVPTLMVAIGFWVAYWRRRILPGRVLLVFTSLVAVFLFVLPMWVLPFKPVFAMQANLAPAAPASTDLAGIHLRNPRNCFPATRVGDLATDAAFVAARQASGLAPWTNEDLRDSGPDSITFFTGTEVRGLPLDWRVKLNYVQADYYAGGNEPRYSLRPATYISDDAGRGLLSHSWVLPEVAVRNLGEARDVSLQLRYWLTLLRPRTFSVPTDGKRHEISGLGFCSAQLDAQKNSIEVSCFSAFEQPAQTSAELNDIPASRVYAAPDFAPPWAKWPYGRNVQLSIASPRLAKHDTITVTAWDVAGYLEKSLKLPGILGADLATCPLTAPDKSFAARWRDGAPHVANSVSVADGVQLEVLNFGGTGSPIVLLPGLGATAHTFDDFAPLLARNHRVIAITRRGAGFSSRPDFGFETARLGQDVIEVMDSMGLEKVLLVGSSIAGDELTWLGGHHPDRLSGLVYLDAAYDRSGSSKGGRLRELNRKLPPEPPIPASALANYDAMKKFMQERGHEPYPEGELIAFMNANNPFLAGTPSIDGRTQQAIAAAIEAPDYASLGIPALAIYAFEDPKAPLPPWYDARDPELLENLAEIDRLREAKKRRDIELFRSSVKKGQVLEMQNARHVIFQSNPAQVLAAIEEFAAPKPAR